MAAFTTVSSQGTQTYQSTPMAFAVDHVSPLQEVQTLYPKDLADLETEEEKMDQKWLDLLNHQMNFCLGLIAHATSSRCANEMVKASVLAHLGRVMGDARKSYEGFREICINIRQAPFSVPPGFARVEYKFTDVQLRNHLARKKNQQLGDVNARWLEFLQGEIPKSRKKKAENPEQVVEEGGGKELPTGTKKRKNASKSSESSVAAQVPQVKPLKIKKSRTKKPKTTATVTSQSEQQLSPIDYQAMLQEHQLAQQKVLIEQQLTQQPEFQGFENLLF